MHGVRGLMLADGLCMVWQCVDGCQLHWHRHTSAARQAMLADAPTLQGRPPCMSCSAFESLPPGRPLLFHLQKQRGDASMQG